MGELIKTLVTTANKPVMINYDRNDPEQHKALLSLALDFLNIKDPNDEEIVRYLASANIRLLKVKGRYVSFLIFKYLDGKEHPVYISTFSVSSKHRRKGYGESFLKAFADHIRTLKIHRVIRLGVREDNDSAIALYTKVGFELIKKGVDGGVAFRVLELKL